MKRREFNQGLLLGLGATAGVVQQAQAQGAVTAWVEGQHYVKLNTPAPTAPAAGKKVDVVEFFWYGCPHCNAFEPLIESWSKQLAADVSFRQVHVGFGAPHQVHQKLYYAMEEMGALPALHRKTFAAIHQQNKRLLSDADIAAFATANGVDGNKLVETMKSFGVNTKAMRARQLSEAYKIDGVPAMGIQGRYYSSATLAGSPESLLKVVEHLVQRSRT